MAFKETVQVMKKLLADLSKDLEKGFFGNKAASQRVRVNSILFEKTSKVFRKESLTAERKVLKGSKKTSIKTKKTKAVSVKTLKKSV